MKTFKTLVAARLALAGAVALSAYTTLAQSWQTVDDFQYVVPGRYDWARSGAVDAYGRVYVCGTSSDGTGTGDKVLHGIVMGSADQGATWTILEDYIHDGTNIFTYLQGIGFDSAQNLYAVGYAEYAGSTIKYSPLFVRKSADYGATWTTVLDVPGSLGNPNAGPGVPGFAADNSGAVYVFTDTGSSGTVMLKSSNAGLTWTTLHPFTDTSYAHGVVCTPAGVFVIGGSVVRKSADGGATWKTVDTGFAQTAICADAQGNTYTGGGASVTTGSGRKAVTTYEWIIRKGTNGGTTWKTVAAFSINGFSGGPNPTYVTTLRALHFDAAGNLYAAGSLTATDGSDHWLVTQSPNQGANWSVVDDFQLLGGSTAAAWFLTSDSAGAVYAGGMGTGPVGGTGVGKAPHWIVRRHLGP